MGLQDVAKVRHGLHIRLRWMGTELDKAGFRRG